MTPLLLVAMLPLARPWEGALDGVIRLAAAASATHSVLPGEVDVGQAFLVDGNLCFANVERIQHPPLRTLRLGARLHKWEDRSLVAIWDAGQGCFSSDHTTQDSTSPAISQPGCLSMSCGEEAAPSCDLLGMLSLCTEDAPLMHALGEQMNVSSATQRMRLTVQDALAATQRLCEETQEVAGGHTALLMQEGRRAVWTAQRDRVMDTWNTTKRQLLRHAALQVHSLQMERIPGLGALVEVVLPAWRDGAALTAQLMSGVDLLAAHANETISSGAAGVATNLLTQSTTLLEQLQTESSLSPQSLALAQLHLELSAEVSAVAMWLGAIDMTTHVHQALGDSCPRNATRLGTITGHHADATRALLDAWISSLQPLSQWQGSQTLAESCLARKAEEVADLAHHFADPPQGWELAPMHTGFGSCRDLHRLPTRLEMLFDDESSASDSTGLMSTTASTANGPQQLRYHPSAAHRVVDDNRSAFLALHMTSTFAGWPGSRRLLESTLDVVSLPRGEDVVAMVPTQRAHIGHVAPARRLADLPCASDACGVDAWCDPALSSVGTVGAGYYSAAGDCARHACTNMDLELLSSATRGQPTYTASGNGTDACPWVCGQGGWAGVDLQCPTTTNSGICRRCFQTVNGFWSPPLSNDFLACSFGLPSVLRGDAIWTAGAGWAEPVCPLLCLKVDMFLHNRSDGLASTSSIDCVSVPNGYFSPARDNDYHPCSTAIDLPPELQVFTSTGGGVDNCTVSPRLQAFVSPTPGDDLAVTTLRPPFTAEAWFQWNISGVGPIAILGSIPHWHLSIQLEAVPGGNGSTVTADLNLVDVSQHAPVSVALPWLRHERWHHVAVVGLDDDSCCYFFDGLRAGCAPLANRTDGVVQQEEPPLHIPVSAYFVGGTHGMEESGFPSGFVDGNMDEVRLHSMALSASQLGYLLTDRALASSCSAGDMVCGGRCVASCPGDAQLDESSCECVCTHGRTLDTAAGRCRFPCGVGTTPDSADMCGCSATDFKVWRGRYLGITSPRLVPDSAQHSWHHRAEHIGLAEVRLFDAQLQRVDVHACREYNLSASDPPADGDRLATTSSCSALYDASAADQAEQPDRAVGQLYLSTGLSAMRVLLDLGRDVDISRIEIANYDRPLHTSHGARRLQLFFAAGGDVPSETELFTPQNLILQDAVVEAASDSSAGSSTTFDDRNDSPARSAAVSCATCIANSSGSVLPRASVHDCICPATHYKEWRHELGRCLPRLPALPPPVSTHPSGVVAPGTLVELGTNGSVGADGTSAAIRWTMDARPLASPIGLAPSETIPAPGVTSLLASLRAHFYTVRAITTHRMHLPSEELTLLLHTKVPLPEPTLHPLAGEARPFPLAVSVMANASAEHAVDEGEVTLRFSADGTNVTEANAPFPPNGVTLHRNTTLRLRSFHPTYFPSPQQERFFFVLEPSRSQPLLPLALQLQGPREVPVGTRVQLTASGAGQIWYSLEEGSDGLSAAQHCDAVHAWSRYERVLQLAQPSAGQILCVYVFEHGYMNSQTVHAQLRVRPWTQPVRIMQQSIAPTPDAPRPELTVTIAGQDGATIWYSLEPSNESRLCDAKVRAVKLAPNLTLAADSEWREALTEVRTAPGPHAPFTTHVTSIDGRLGVHRMHRWHALMESTLGWRETVTPTNRDAGALRWLIRARLPGPFHAHVKLTVAHRTGASTRNRWKSARTSRFAPLHVCLVTWRARRRAPNSRSRFFQALRRSRFVLSSAPRQIQRPAPGCSVSSIRPLTARISFHDHHHPSRHPLLLLLARRHPCHRPRHLRRHRHP